MKPVYSILSYATAAALARAVNAEIEKADREHTFRPRLFSTMTSYDTAGNPVFNAIIETLVPESQPYVEDLEEEDTEEDDDDPPCSECGEIECDWCSTCDTSACKCERCSDCDCHECECSRCYCCGEKTEDCECERCSKCDGDLCSKTTSLDDDTFCTCPSNVISTTSARSS